MILAPSGGGKDTILKEVLGADDKIKLSISAATRSPREGEVDGEHYHFISKDEFQKLIDTNQMLEHAVYLDNYYGTPKTPIEKWTADGYDVFLEIEIQGGQQIKEKLPECVSIFILPPSMEVLEKRLRKRGTETEEAIQKRLNRAREEVPHAKDYDYVVVNDKLEDAVADVQSIIRAERLKYKRNEDIIEGVLKNA